MWFLDKTMMISYYKQTCQIYATQELQIENLSMQYAMLFINLR